MTDEERRFYAAGMSARRRGENTPHERLPFEHYRLWKKGWERAHRNLKRVPNTRVDRAERAEDHHSFCQGRHMIRTEVETLDEALNVIADRQKAAKISATHKARPQIRTLKQQLNSDKQRQRLKAHHEKRRTEIAPLQEHISDFERRQVERIEKAIEMFCFSIEECSTIAAMQRYYPDIGPKSLIPIIERLCRLIRRPVPRFDVSRVPGQESKPHCMNCGAELGRNELGYCLHCEPPDPSIKIASELRREHFRNLAGMTREIKEIGNLIDDLETVIDHGDD
jgi:hypothetical protein